MDLVLIVIWLISAFIIFWAMIGYPIFLVLLQKVFKKPEITKDYDYKPSVCVMVTAHNEEKVILNKLQNLITLDYPSELYSIIVTSDYSTDKTNEIVEKFIAEHPDFNISLHKTKNHFGKTNAQNEAQKLVTADILIMTDANCSFKKDAIVELVSVFSNSSIAYACGSTVFVNSEENATTQSESTYWDLDSKCRDIESRFQTITAGDGNIYACRNSLYEDIPPIQCHDSSFPVLFALNRYRAVFVPNAIAFEKSGLTDQDEFKRKVRMNRILFRAILPSFAILNIFKLKWFTLFYLGHRTCRYLLWLSHLLVFLLSAVLIPKSLLWLILFILQMIFYIISVIGLVTNTKNRIIKLASYYSMTIFAQWKGAYNIITGKAKPTWSKAESTR